MSIFGNCSGRTGMHDRLSDKPAQEGHMYEYPCMHSRRVSQCGILQSFEITTISWHLALLADTPDQYLDHQSQLHASHRSVTLYEKILLAIWVPSKLYSYSCFHFLIFDRNACNQRPAKDPFHIAKESQLQSELASTYMLPNYIHLLVSFLLYP